MSHRLWLVGVFPSKPSSYLRFNLLIFTDFLHRCLGHGPTLVPQHQAPTQHGVNAYVSKELRRLFAVHRAEEPVSKVCSNTRCKQATWAPHPLIPQTLGIEDRIRHLRTSQSPVLEEVMRTSSPMSRELLPTLYRS